MAQLIYIQVENGVVARPLVYVFDRKRAPGSAAYTDKMASLFDVRTATRRSGFKSLAHLPWWDGNISG